LKQQEQMYPLTVTVSSSISVQR